MGKIQQMPDVLANQIAAGEVVERPASVVKELVENAIDAGAQTIRVDLREAGIQSIRVRDDGEGMDAEDLAKAFLPHATSKLYDVQDLFQIRSLGFRGEALASIGSVAKVRVESMTQDAQEGHYITIAGSQIQEEGLAPARKGTWVQVDSLFYNTPARLKHLSSLKTELRHSLNFIQEIALAYPGIRFQLSNDDQLLFQSYGTGDLRQTIANVYQPAIARQLIPLEAENTEFRLKGYLSPPQLTRRSKHYIHWMINQRAVRSYALTEVLIKTYGRQLMIGRYPMAVIQIDLDPQLVDVNVHPTKQTVRLSKEEELSRLLVEAVETALGRLNPIPHAQVEELQLAPASRSQQQLETSLFVKEAEDREQVLEVPEVPTGPEGQPNQTGWDLGQSKPPRSASDGQVEESLAPVLATDIEPEVLVEDRQEQEAKQAQIGLEQQPQGLELDQEASRSGDERPLFGQLRYVGQIHGTYLIAESPQGFYLIDQHAAQERIRYEAFMNQTIDETQQQLLLLPYLFHLSAAELASMEVILPRLATLGIYLEPFGPQTYQLESYPTWLKPEEVEQTVQDLLQRLGQEPNLTIQAIKEAALIMQSCRGAIKANHYLDEAQASHLIRSLDGLADPFHCPHGRPVFVAIEAHTLEKLFKRIQDPHQGGQVR